MTVIGQGVEICTSTTRPSSPIVGTMIYETDTASYRWCSGVGPVVWTGMIPVGTVQSFSGSTAPPGWLFCFGQSLNATSNPQYADLWSVLGTTYGGSGVTAFSVPDLRGRAPYGKDNMGGSAASRVTNAASGITGTTLGATGGDQNMHQHNHGVNDSGHSHGGRTEAYSQASGWSGVNAVRSATSSYTLDNQYIATATTGITIQNQGSGSSQNMPPTIILNYIIKF